MSLTVQDHIKLERVVDPSSAEYKSLMALLLKSSTEKPSGSSALDKKPDGTYILPFRGDADEEMEVVSRTAVKFADKGPYRNGAAALAGVFAELLDLISQASSRKRHTATMVISAEADLLRSTVISAGAYSTLIYYYRRVNLVDAYKDVADKLETMVFDHSSVHVPIDKLLNFAYDAGIKVVDGVFPFHIGALQGWDVTCGTGKWSYTHTKSSVIVGPESDSSKLIKYARRDYRAFVDPKLWEGNSRKYVYEIRRIDDGLATYRAVYVGDSDCVSSPITFKLPNCSSDEMMLVTVNKDLAAGAYVSRSNNARELAELKKNYAIEVRKDLFGSCVNYLLSLSKGADIIGDATRYIYQHNYVDLMDGVRVVRRPALSYADALCVAMVCSLTAFSYRYKLTNEGMIAAARSRRVAHAMQPGWFSFLYRITWLIADAVFHDFPKFMIRSVDKAALAFAHTDMIPGVCYDAYLDNYYQPDQGWFQSGEMAVKPTSVVAEFESKEIDPFVGFFGASVSTSAPTMYLDKPKSEADMLFTQPSYVPNVIKDPVAVVQDVYDEAFPGNSVAQIQNVAELRRVNDVNINTEFHGEIRVNRDVAAPEMLHKDLPVRTTALPVSRTPLLDAIMASAKRNFNPPDLQMQTAVFDYAQHLVEEFVSHCFFPNFNDTVRKMYQSDPITFNLDDYFEWLSTRDGAYKSAMFAECPNELVELEMSRYDTIVKKRIKPKLTVAAQQELSQPQVIVSLSKKDTAPFTSVFRKVFERFDECLRPGIMSAGRASDEDISRYFTRYLPDLVSLSVIETDSGKYDKSQNLLARLIESKMMEVLGLDPSVGKLFEDSYVGRVSSRSLGLAYVSVYQMKSGGPDTMFGNLIYNYVSAGKSIGFENIRYMIAKGDDNLIWPSSGTDHSLLTSKMATLFNLESKTITGEVPYFSSGYVVVVDSFAYFVSDPLKIAELLGERTPDSNTLAEQFTSFRDRVAAYLVNSAIPSRLQLLVRSRVRSPSLDVVSLVDAFFAISQSFSLFRHIKTGLFVS